MLENGKFTMTGEDGSVIPCDALFTYDCETNGRSYIVFTAGTAGNERLYANRFEKTDDGQNIRLLAIENEKEYKLIRHCFEELKTRLIEEQELKQAAAAEQKAAEPEQGKDEHAADGRI